MQVEKEAHCKHFVRRKKRFCRMTLKKGQEYCGEHLPKPEEQEYEPKTENATDRRIECPLDPKQYASYIHIWHVTCTYCFSCAITY